MEKIWVISKGGKVEEAYPTKKLADEALAYKRWSYDMSGLDSSVFIVKEMPVRTDVPVKTEAPQIPAEWKHNYLK